MKKLILSRLASSYNLHLVFISILPLRFDLALARSNPLGKVTQNVTVLFPVLFPDLFPEARHMPYIIGAHTKPLDVASIQEGFWKCVFAVQAAAIASRKFDVELKNSNSPR